jgi:Nif-specific regulatory protein
VDDATIGVLCIDREMNTYTDDSLAQDARLLHMISNLLSHSIRLHRQLTVDTQKRIRARQRWLRLDQRVHGIAAEHGSCLQNVFEEVERAAASPSTVLIRGELGSGKEVIANAIHQLGSRRDGPLLCINCAALSESQLESELFGQETRRGLLDLAAGGTLFLDEIAEISRPLQMRLLHVLQKQEFEPMTGGAPVAVDFRLIVATSCNLELLVIQGGFRADLYFRINVISIILPPLRGHSEEIPRMDGRFPGRMGSEHLNQPEH